MIKPFSRILPASNVGLCRAFISSGGGSIRGVSDARSLVVTVTFADTRGHC
jgi:hypothetical protein